MSLKTVECLASMVRCTRNCMSSAWSMTLPSSNQISDRVVGFGFVSCALDALRRFVGGVGSVAGMRTLGVKYEGMVLQCSIDPGSRDNRVKSRVQGHTSRLCLTYNTTTIDNDDDDDGAVSSASLGAS